MRSLNDSLDSGGGTCCEPLEVAATDAGGTAMHTGFRQFQESMTQLERRRLEEIAVQNIPWNPCVATPLESTGADISHNVEEKFDYPVMNNGWVQKEISVPAAGPCLEAPVCAIAERQPVSGVPEAYVHGDHPMHTATAAVVGVHMAAQPTNGMVVEEVRSMEEMEQTDHHLHHQHHHQDHDHMASSEDPAPFFGVLSPLSPIREVAETGSTPRAELPCADGYVVQEQPHGGDYIYPDGHGPQSMDPEIKTPDSLEGCQPSMQTSRQRYLQIRDKFLSR